MSRDKHRGQHRARGREGLHTWRGASMLVLSMALGVMGLTAVAGRPTDVTYLTLLSLAIVAKAVVALAGESAAATTIEAPGGPFAREGDAGSRDGEADHD
jgi:hypothetical protein